METVTVTTKEDLEKAVEKGYSEIIVKGDLAEKVRNGVKLKTLNKATIAIIAGAIAAIPFTGGISTVAAASIAAMSGAEIALIVAIIFLGIGLIEKLLEQYDEILVSKDEVVLRKKGN